VSIEFAIGLRSTLADKKRPRKFDALVSDPKNQYWFQLKPGKMLRKSWPISTIRFC
jgi:hypothetical protein